MATQQPEPWLRGTLTDVDGVQRAVMHALELAAEDLREWCSGLTTEEMNARPHGIAPVAFHLRHIARSLDRLLTYAEGDALTSAQLAELRSELNPGADSDSGGNASTLFAELETALRLSAQRVRAFSPTAYNTARWVGRTQLPTTVGGLLVHCADHTQRHTGQAVTTAKIVMDMRRPSN